MSKHTPGPWTVMKGVKRGDFPGIESEWDSIVIWGRETDDDIDDGGIRGPDAATAEANARLIAAAPDLLEAAKEMADYFEGHIRDYHGDDPDEWVVYTDIRAAIAKAEGGEG